MQCVGILTESGEVLTHYHHMFNKTDTTCRFFLGKQKQDVHARTRFGGIVDTSSSYFGQNRHSKYTQHVVYGSVPGWCPQCQCSYHHNIFMCHKYHVKHTSKQCNLDCLKSGSKKGHQGDTNLCGAYARPTDERSLVRGGGGYNQDSFVYFTKACGCWVYVGFNGVG